MCVINLFFWEGRSSNLGRCKIKTVESRNLLWRNYFVKTVLAYQLERYVSEYTIRFLKWRFHSNFGTVLRSVKTVESRNLFLEKLLLESPLNLLIGEVSGCILKVCLSQT